MSQSAVGMEQRVQQLMKKQQLQHYVAMDRMFGVLMIFQWLAAIAAAYWISPLAWEGMTSRIHPHVWLAIGLGGAIASLPLIFDFAWPGQRVARYVNSAAQVLFSGLLIHITGGRIETHFHVFGSLAFLACYRDWKVLIPATAIVAVDHFVRGLWWPESVFGIATASHWRWLEHAGWVVFEDIFLVLACLKAMSEMRVVATRTVALEETEYWKKSVLNAALDAIVTIDEAGRVTEWNGEAVQIFGWSTTEALGTQLHELIIPDRLHSDYLSMLEKFRETGSMPTLDRRLEITALRRDRSEFPAEFAVTPIHAQDQVTFCSFIRDISERKEHEQELLRSKDAAEAASRAKSSFLANMSHEIRTPLNGILGFAELLRRGADGGNEAARQEFIDTIDKCGRHLLTVINDVLDLSKIEAGQFEISRTTCSPHDILADVVSILRVKAKEKGLTLNYRWEGDVPESIETDADRLRQVLMNVVGNAIKFTDDGSVTIVANLEADSIGTTRLAINVKDTGIGIAPDKITAIFAPFVQGDSSVTRRYGGTGLGLSICKSLCELLGGTISVQSQLGLGSVFTFTVDAGHMKFSPSPTIVQGDVINLRAKAGDAGSGNLDGRDILLVEDGEVNRQFLRLLLEQTGATVATAEDGQQGLQQARQRAFDAIILDMQMPIMDGYKAATEMRASGITCPIIALTAHAMSGDADKCLRAGCSHYLSKPVKSAHLIDTLLDVLGDSSERWNSAPSLDSSATDDSDLDRVMDSIGSPEHAIY